MRSRSRLALLMLVLAGCAAPGCDGDDVARLCGAQSGANASAVTDWPVVERWVDAHMRTPEGRDLARQLAQLPPAERGRVLRDRAAADGLVGCPLADTWSPGPRPDPYAQDLVGFCGMTPPLDPYVIARVDGGTRVDLMRVWANAHARTPALFALVGRIAAAPPRDRGPLLHQEFAQRLSGSGGGRCRLADALAAPSR